MKWYNVVLLSAPDFTRLNVRLMDSCSISRFYVRVEAEDNGGAADEALYRFEKSFGTHKPKPVVDSITLESEI